MNTIQEEYNQPSSNPRSPSPELREFVLRRDNYTCQYCGNTSGPFHVDHVYPFSKGGRTEEGNLVTACVSCNQHKSSKVGIWPKPKDYVKNSRVDIDLVGNLRQSYYTILAMIMLISAVLGLIELPEMKCLNLFFFGLFFVFAFYALFGKSEVR